MYQALLKVPLQGTDTAIAMTVAAKLLERLDGAFEEEGNSFT